MLIIEDKYQFKPPRPFAPGGEIAGEVEAVGEGVEGWKPGDRLIAVTGLGGMAEKLVIPAERAIPLPAERSFEDGAALLLTYATSIHAFSIAAGCRPGRPLLVLGAAGGVGLAAVELGKAKGARVIAAVSSEEKAAAARAPAPTRPSSIRPDRSTRTGKRRWRHCSRTLSARRRRCHLRSCRRRLCRARAARHRLGRALPGGRFPGRDPQASAQPDAAQELRRLRRLLGRLRGARSQGPMPPMSRSCSAVERGQDRPESAPPIRSSGAAKRSRGWPRGRCHRQAGG